MQIVAQIAKSFTQGQPIKFFSANRGEVIEATFGMAGTIDGAGREWTASTFRADGSRVTLWFGKDTVCVEA